MNDVMPVTGRAEIGCVSNERFRESVVDVWNNPRGGGAGAQLIIESDVHIVLRAALGHDVPVICDYIRRDAVGSPVYEWQSGMSALGSLIRAKLELDKAIEQMVRRGSGGGT